jgi:phage repressor protein C with HTH and peptisase S24 domain
MAPMIDTVFKPRQVGVMNRSEMRAGAVILPHMEKDMLDRINRRLAELDLTPRAASLMVSTNPDLFRGVLRKGTEANPTTETVTLMAQALQVTKNWLESGDGPPPQVPPAGEFRLAPDVRADVSGMPRDVPVRGTALGSLLEGNFEGFDFFGSEAVDYVRRPPALTSVRDAYAIYVSGDSMDPMHPPGELRFVNPHRPVAPGDSVIVVTRHWEHDPGQGYIKILRRRHADFVRLEQLNPAATIDIPMKHVVSIHRVLTLSELFGL